MIDDKTLERLKQQKMEINERIKKAKVRKKHDEIKRASLKKEVVGRYYLERAEAQGQAELDALKKLMDEYLKLDSERELFGLLPLDKK